MSRYAWPWDQDAKAWSLQADPRYQVRDFTFTRPEYDMLIDGHVVDSRSTLVAAFEALECRYEYEEHGAELELARLRLRQARERLAERYPRAASDPQLASILSGLEDALGRGPEAAEPEPEDSPKGTLLTPDLLVAFDGACIVLVVTEPYGRLLRKVTIPDVDAAKAALDRAREQQRIAMEEADNARVMGRFDRLRSEGKLSRSEAVDWLTDHGHSHSDACTITRLLHAGEGTERAGMTYDGTYWRVPAEESS